MIKYKFIGILLFFNTLNAQFTGPIASISSGYGADGSYAVGHIDIPNDHNSILKPISIFYPTGASGPLPTIFYSHGYGSSDTSFHIETLHHIASKGYVVVFVPYKALGITIPQRYITLFDGFTKAARTNTTLIDTTRVGFYGQSFGGGATPRIAYRAFTENNWGANGKFIFCSAPWYSFELGSTNLSGFPPDCSMLTVLYNDDITNDHRMGMDIFNSIAIDDSIKDCLTVYSDTISTYVYQADHTLPPQYSGAGEFDALDYYVTFRLLDAIADYSFNGNQLAKDVALGNGSNAQLYMGGQLKNLTHSNHPNSTHPQTNYTYPCNHSQNERISFCSTTNISEKIKNEIKIAPNPTTGAVTITPKKDYQNINVSIYSIYGQKIIELKNQQIIDLSFLPDGIYLSKITVDKLTSISKIVKKK